MVILILMTMILLMSLPTVFNDIDSAITISFWCYGDENKMPFNSYVFEGRDQNGYRVVNCHLPWSNSNVYWDAGNNGTGSYDRVNQTANFNDFAGKWNHWAFTKDVQSGEMIAYLNGEVFMSGTAKLVFQVSGLVERLVRVLTVYMMVKLTNLEFGIRP